MERRSWIRWLAADVRIFVETEGRPFHRYAVGLQVLVGNRWHTVRLFDNAHGEHDVHRYVGAEKQPAERFIEGTPQAVLPAAVRYLDAYWEGIARAWRN